MSAKSDCYIIDVLSIRGNGDEVNKLKIQDTMNSFSDYNIGDICLQSKILICMIKEIQAIKENIFIIIYFQHESQKSENFVREVDYSKLFKNVKVLTGQQALFYFIGKKSNETIKVRCISKEKVFFTQKFCKLAKELKDNFEWKAYPLHYFQKSIN